MIQGEEKDNAGNFNLKADLEFWDLYTIWMFESPSNSYVEILMCHVKVLGCGAFRQSA